MQTDVILDLFTDREGGLWLCLNSGVTRAEIGSGLTVFDAAGGLKRTTARDLLRFCGELFAAATGAFPGCGRRNRARPAGALRATPGFFSTSPGPSTFLPAGSPVPFNAYTV